MQNAFFKIVVFILGIVAIIFTFSAASQKTLVVSQSSNKKNVQLNSETATTTKKGVMTAIDSLQASSTKKVIPKIIPVQKITTVIAPTSTLQTVAVPQTVSIPFDQINTTTRATLVNIICNTKSAGPFSPISGSGVIISSDGIILTNAHIGQYWLLRNFNGVKDFVQCLIRTGSPAYPAYIAELVYISPTWIENNSTILIDQNPQGTGEHDYAFLKIISRVDGSPITNALPYIPISLNENINLGDNILLASYPAEFLGSIDIEKDLYESSAITQVSHIYTFDTNTVDLISVPGTVVSQKGSSGGAAVNAKAELAGIITTSSEADTTGARDLRAITTTYINRDLIANNKINFQTILQNPQSVSESFNQNIAPALTKILTDAILKK